MAIEEWCLHLLFKAIRDGDVTAAKEALDYGADVNMTENVGGFEFTSLAMALTLGKIDVALLLLDQDGVDVNCRVLEGETTLCTAANHPVMSVDCVMKLLRKGVRIMPETALLLLKKSSQCGNLEVLQALMARNVSINTPNADHFGWTPLCYAVTSRASSFKTIKQLLLLGADASVVTTGDDTPLSLFLKNKNRRLSTNKKTRIALLLLLHTDRRLVLLPSSKDGATCLHGAARYDLRVAARVLLFSGADPNAKNHKGGTPLYRAAYRGHAQVVRLLLENAGDPNSEDSMAFTPVHSAACRGHFKTVQLLVENGGNPNAQGSSDNSPLAMAACGGHLQVVRCLVENGANPIIKDKCGVTPLHLAAREGHLEVVDFLLEKTGEPNVKTYMGTTPLHCAAQKGHLPTVRLLLENGAHVNGFSASEEASEELPPCTILHSAINRNHGAKLWQLVVDLVQYGADPLLPNVRGKTAIEKAAGKMEKHLASWLAFVAMFGEKPCADWDYESVLKHTVDFIVRNEVNVVAGPGGKSPLEVALLCQGLDMPFSVLSASVSLLPVFNHSD